jgi:hypothetical protein
MYSSAKLFKRGARKKDPALMWAILQNLSGVLDSFLQAAEEQYLVSKWQEEINEHEKEAKVEQDFINER